MDPKKRRSALVHPLVHLGLHLARSGGMAVFSMILAGIITLGGVTVAFALGRRGGRAVADVPGITASALAWGAGVLLAFGVASQVLRKDRDHGIRALVEARRGGPSTYLTARVGGLVAILVGIVGGGTLLTALASIALAGRGSLGAVAQASGAAMVYALAFAITLGPLAIATLGARSRAGGYLWLLLVLVLPELFQGWTDQILPYEWRDLGSIPGALGALRGALAPPGADLGRFVRALVVLAAVTVAATLAIRAQLARVDSEART
jgi:hypothetical protein